MNTAKPIVDLTYEEFKDGTVLAQLDKCGKGDIWAKDEATLLRGMAWLMDHLIEAEHRRICNNSTKGMFGGGMEGVWLEGVLVVRWLPVPGFGVSFANEEDLTAWMTALVKIAIEATKKESK
jgi:hypothetical protein